MPTSPSATVFISYSWDSQEHQDWVLKLANDLMERYGIPVLLDQYELSAGRELAYFMETSIQKADKVLLIMTPNYQARADKRTGGVGFEYSMISQGMYASQIEGDKFIPILREATADSSSPMYVKGRLYHDMRDSGHYESQLFQLARLILNKPALKKPQLGNVPDFDSIDADPLLYELQQLSAQVREQDKLKSIINREGIDLAAQQVSSLYQLIQAKAVAYSVGTDFRFTVEASNQDSLLLTTGHHSVVFHWEQPYSNTLTDALLSISRWKGRPSFSGRRFYFHGEEPYSIMEDEYSFALASEQKTIWKPADGGTATNEILVHDAFSYLLEKIKEDRTK
jgi:hypothetical protein